MPNKKEKVRTSTQFAVPRLRAKAMAAVAEEYPPGVIDVTVTPITEQTAATLGEQALRVRLGESSRRGLPEEVKTSVQERYKTLGESGTSAVVELNVPGGMADFDFKGFYERVEDLLDPV